MERKIDGSLSCSYVFAFDLFIFILVNHPDDADDDDKILRSMKTRKTKRKRCQRGEL